MAVAWNNLSHQGRVLRRIFDRLDNKSKNINDTEILIKIANSMGQLAAQTVRLADHVDTEIRITNLEKIIQQIPQTILRQYCHEIPNPYMPQHKG